MTLISRLLPITAITAVTISLVGCSTNSNGSQSESIKFMGVASVGSALSNYPDVDAGLKAAVKSINDAGGVNGKKIDYSFCNTNGDVNDASSCMRTAVSNKVAAVVGRADTFSENTTAIIEAAKIPDLGNFVAGAAADAKSPVSFPIVSGNFGTYMSAGYIAKQTKAAKFAIVGVDVALSHTQAELAKKAAEAAGYSDVQIIYIPAQGVTDYAPYVQSLKDNGAQFALLMLGPARTQAFYKARASVGLTTQLITTGFSFADAEATATGPSADGTWIASPFANPLDTSIPGIKTYNAELDAAGYQGNDAVRRPAGLNAWLAMHAAAKVAAGISGTVDAASMTAALQKTTDLDIAGLLKWSPSALTTGGAYSRLPASQIFVYKFVNSALVPAGIDPVSDPVISVR